MIRYLRAANVVDGALDLTDVKEMNFTPEEQTIFALRTGDVLVSEGSGSLRTVGASAVWNSELSDTICFQNTLLRLRPRSAFTDPGYLAWWCRHAYADGLFAVNAAGANIYHLSAERLRSISITIPDLAIQRSIAEFLATETARIDALIAKKRQHVLLLEERRQGRIEFTIRELAAAWGETPLKILTEQVTVGIVVTPAAWYTALGVPALRGINVQPGEVHLDELVYITAEGHSVHAKSALRENDVVVVRTGQAGAAAVVPASLDGANCIDLIVVRPAKSVSSKFLEYVLNSDWTRKHIEMHSVGTIQSHFNVSAIKIVPVPQAPMSEQLKVVDRLNSAVAHARLAVDCISRQIALLQERRQALITAAVTGELDIPGVAA